MAPYIIITVGALLSFMISRFFANEYKGGMSGGALLGLIAIQMVLLFITLLGSAYGGSARGFGVLFFYILLWFPGTMYTVYLLMDYVGYVSMTSMFFPKIAQPLKNKLVRMRGLLWDEDVPGAVRACLEEFEKYPEDFEILLDGSNLLHERGAHLEALRLLEKAMHVFYEDDIAWSQAAYKAASIRMEHLDDEETACMLFRKIVDRLPESEVGMRSRERMHRDSNITEPPEPETPRYSDEPKPQQEQEEQQDADPFYKRLMIKQAEIIEEPDTPEPVLPSLEDEMPGMFLDDDMSKK